MAPELLRHETFGGSYPFRANFLTIGELQAHYVDERPESATPKGTIVLLHGNPTWSYLYRNFIPPLVAEGYRCIAPDQIGYGKSDKLKASSDYLLAKRIERFTDFMNQMDLGKVTLVMQDWGGPVGMGYAVNHPERIERLVVMSTWAWVPPINVPDTIFGPMLRLCRSEELGEAVLLGYNFFVEGFIPMCLVRKERITKQLMDAYRAPFPDYHSRMATTVVKDIPMRSDHPSFDTLKSLEQKLELLNVPTCIIWGEQDTLLEAPRFVPIWKAIYPHSESHMIPRAGHFLQEDAPEEVTEVILDFLSRTMGSGVSSSQ